MVSRSVWARGGLAAVLFMAAILAAAPDGYPEVVASINGRDISGAALARRVAQSRSMDSERFGRMTAEERRQATRRVLRAMVLEEVEYQEAVRRGLTVDDAEIEELLDREIKRYGSRAAFAQTLATGEITIDEWKRDTRRRLVIAKLERAEPGSHQRAAWLRSLTGAARITLWSP